MADFFGTRKVRVVVDSTDGVQIHTFNNTEDWLNEVYWARIFAGFHFGHSLQDGAALGKQVASQLFENHFGLKHEHDR